ncbi:MAG: BolA family transcriptional regulator [Rhizobiaceae bacterium]
MSIMPAIEARLRAALSPHRLEIINESDRHAGHHHVVDGHAAEFDGEGETHLRIRIVADRFAGMSRVDRHRTINALVKEELDAGLHALAIEAAAPGEAVRW